MNTFETNVELVAQLTVFPCIILYSLFSAFHIQCNQYCFVGFDPWDVSTRGLADMMENERVSSSSSQAIKHTNVASPQPQPPQVNGFFPPPHMTAPPQFNTYHPGLWSKVLPPGFNLNGYMPPMHPGANHPHCKLSWVGGYYRHFLLCYKPVWLRGLWSVLVARLQACPPSMVIGLVTLIQACGWRSLQYALLAWSQVCSQPGGLVTTLPACRHV